MQQMITCPRCGQPNQMGQRYCWHCGNTLATGCPNCGAGLDPGSRFCGNCGAQLPPTQQQGGWGQPPPPPQQPGGWGQPPPPQPGGWGQPPPPQQPGGWGQPPPPQPGGWGQPPPPQQPGGWGPPPGGMPQPGAWGQPMPRKSGAGGLVILLIVLLIGLGAFSYFAFFDPNPPWGKTPSTGTPGTTIAIPITEGPFVFQVSSDNSTKKIDMEIKWTTKDLYKGQLEYGEDTKYGKTTQLGSDFVTAHKASLPALSPDTSYNYRIILKSKDNKEWKSENSRFKTPKL